MSPPRARRGQLTLGPWIGVSSLGLLVLSVPLYDIWDDVSNLSWNPATTLVENSVLVLLAFGLVGGGVWVARQDWDPKYEWTVTKWSLGIALGIAALYALVIGLQQWAMGGLKPLVLALDGVLFGSVAAFGIGTYNATRQMARDELARSREEYRTLTDDVLDTSDVATFVLDSDFRIVWTNAAAESYFGLDRGAILGRDKRELLDDLAPMFEDEEGVRGRLAAAYDDNAYVEEFECHLSGEGVEERWLQHWSQPVESGLYEGGRIEHYTDISEVKAREAKLDRRERHLREMYDVVSDSSRTFEEQVGGLIDIGRSLFDADYGAFARADTTDGTYEPEVVRAEQSDLAGGDVVPLSETHCVDMLAEEETLQFATRPFDAAEREYGTDVGFEMYVGTPVYADDTVYGSLCFLDRQASSSFDDWELTMVELMGNWVGYELDRERLVESKRRALRDQTAKFEEFVETVDNYAIFALDAEGRVASWNTGAERIKGYEEAEIVGEPLETFYPEESVEAGVPDELLAEAEADGRTSQEGWRVRKDGSMFWADVTIAARYDDGDHVGYTKVVRDMTERREYERALEHERERLEFLNRIIRHNILNGLNLVNARADLLQNRHVADPDAEAHLETIQTRVDDLASLIDTMRTFMDAILTDADHETHPVPVREELDEKVELARQTYDDAEFSVRDLPEESARVLADELVGELFENVFSNAVVHNDKDVPEVEIWASETTREVPVHPDTGRPSLDGSDERGRRWPMEERSVVTVHVADNGPGIPDEDKRAVLEKGVSELSEPGNGFGLYLVKEMMYAYGGRVDIRDNDGQGTVFDLTFLRVD